MYKRFQSLLPLLAIYVSITRIKGKESMLGGKEREREEGGALRIRKIENKVTNSFILHMHVSNYVALLSA